MSDLIYKEDVIKIIDEEIKAKSDYLQHNAQIDIMYKVQELPTVEAKPVVHGEWLQEGNAVYHWRQNCSICGNPVYDKIKPYNFCPNCGARMDMRGEKHD